MILEGDTSVIDALKEKKRLMESGEPHEHIKIMLIVDGGLIKGAYGVGAGLVFENEGYTHAFSNIVGVSSGAVSSAYFVGGNVSVGSSLIYEECCSKDFFNFWTLTANTKFIIEVTRGKTGKPINTEKILSAKTSFYVGVAEYETAKPVLVAPKTEEELFASLHASIQMPTMTTEPVYVKGGRYVDGGFTAPHIIEKAVADIEATHVLILTNQNYNDDKLSKAEHFFIETLMRFRMNKTLRYVGHRRKKLRYAALEKISTATKAPVATVWGDGSIEGLEHNPKKIKAIVERSEAWWKQLLTE